MSTPEPVSTDAITQLRARLARLQADPRVHLVPDGVALAAVLVGVCEQFAALERRIAALERGLAGLVQREEFE